MDLDLIDGIVEGRCDRCGKSKQVLVEVIGVSGDDSENDNVNTEWFCKRCCDELIE